MWGTFAYGASSIYMPNESWDLLETLPIVDVENFSSSHPKPSAELVPQCIADVCIKWAMYLTLKHVHGGGNEISPAT